MAAPENELVQSFERPGTFWDPSSTTFSEPALRSSDKCVHFHQASEQMSSRQTGNLQQAFAHKAEPFFDCGFRRSSGSAASRSSLGLQLGK